MKHSSWDLHGWLSNLEWSLLGLSNLGWSLLGSFYEGAVLYPASKEGPYNLENYPYEMAHLFGLDF